METPLELTVNKALQVYQKMSIKHSQVREARKQGLLKDLLTSKRTIRNAIKLSSRNVKPLEKLTLPYLEMPESSLKIMGMRLRKNRRKAEF